MEHTHNHLLSSGTSTCTKQVLRNYYLAQGKEMMETKLRIMPTIALFPFSFKTLYFLKLEAHPSISTKLAEC